MARRFTNEILWAARQAGRQGGSCNSGCLHHARVNIAFLTESGRERKRERERERGREDEMRVPLSTVAHE